MIFYVFVVSDFFKYKAKNIFKSILFVWIHVTTDSFVSLIKDPLETSINFTAFIHRKRDRRHFKVNWKFVCFFLIFFGIFKKDKVVALSFNETNVTLGEYDVSGIINNFVESSLNFSVFYFGFERIGSETHHSFKKVHLDKEVFC